MVNRNNLGLGKCNTPVEQQQDFWRFLSRSTPIGKNPLADQPKDKEIHIVADNLSAHKTERVEAFL